MESTVRETVAGNGCALYKKCNGCQLQNMDYEQQLRFKQGKVITLLGKFCHVEPIIGMENPLHYRCKVQAAFGQGRKGVISGIYQSSSHRIVPVDSCMIEDENADRIIVTIRKLAEKMKIKPFRDDKMSGFLRHVLVRKGRFTGEIMVVLVTFTRDFPAGKAFVSELLR
ncbi:MAG: 23S rRNA (uracil(1939)-C(5))-methyltransferase RlmD, partial [Oscillospiraceae bacterium]|nr:23S rRNA (uracil(1939)-C(5))-methyltransferase RlmD [Oscillospiraceae bacterium]